MEINTFGLGAMVVVLIMAIVTLITRWGGVYVMAFVPINKRVAQFIRAMSGSVIVSVIAPLAITGDLAAKIALLVTAIIMLRLRKPLIAISGGIFAAALTRLLL